MSSMSGVVSVNAFHSGVSYSSSFPSDCTRLFRYLCCYQLLRQELVVVRVWYWRMSGQHVRTFRSVSEIVCVCIVTYCTIRASFRIVPIYTITSLFFKSKSFCPLLLALHLRLVFTCAGRGGRGNRKIRASREGKGTRNLKWEMREEEWYSEICVCWVLLL